MQKIFIICVAFGVSSNGRTRDFGSLYHGSNPCAPTKIKNTPLGYFFIWYSHGLCKYVSHLHRKTLLMFCNHFGKSQISQNGNGGTPPFPRVRPNQKLKRPCGVFVFGSWPRFAARNRRLPVRKQVDVTSTSAVTSLRFPRSRPAPRELSAPPLETRVTCFCLWFSVKLYHNVSI